MPVVRGKEVKVTEDDIHPQQELITHPQPQPPKPNLAKTANHLADRALLRLYLNISPFLLCLVLIVPLILWVGNVLLRRYTWLVGEIFGAGFAHQMANACPPTCTWHNLLVWAILGGIGLLFAFLLSVGLRKRLLRAIR